MKSSSVAFWLLSFICVCRSFSFIEEHKSNEIGAACKTIDNEPGVCALPEYCENEIRYWSDNHRTAKVCEFQQNFNYTICCPRKSICRNYLPAFISNGQITHPAEFPFIAALGWTNSVGYVEWKCGGSLITGYYVLTAAHCTENNNIPPDIVRIGDTDLRNDSDNPYAINVKIEEIIKHPNYTHTSHYNDIALIKLSKYVSSGPDTYPICLQNVDKLENQTAFVIGYGHTEFAAKSADVLLKAHIPILDTQSCTEFYDVSRGLKQGIVNSQICAGDLIGNRDTCQGDSGGPLFTEDPKNYLVYRKLVGVTSLGKGCGNQSPALYTRVSTFIDWIESIAWS